MDGLDKLLNTPITVTPNEIMHAISRAGTEEITKNPAMIVFMDEIAAISGKAIAILIRSKKEDK